jgi:catechol 2,3-dioxygenase-like lactoylglutathione lyase family enzyme
MICSIDHIALTCSDAKSACSKISSWGYQKVFTETGMPNPLIKRPLMKNWSEKHDVFYFRRDGALNIEVIRYDTVHRGQSFLDKQEKPFEKGIVLYSRELEAGYRFWSLFGLRLVRKDSDRYWCLFRSPLLGELTFVIIQRTAALKDFALDTEGFNCIAFLSTSIDQERDFLLDSGVKTTPVENVVVNGKNMAILFAEGKDGEIVEVIGLKKG